jgi:hypothetical protein
MSSILFSVYTSERIAATGIQGLQLSCGHEMTRTSYYTPLGCCCLECQQPLLPVEQDLLRLIPINTPPEDISTRMFSVRATDITDATDATGATGATDITVATEPKNSVECNVCRRPYNSTNLIGVLACGHFFCIDCLQHPTFQTNPKCFLCRTQFAFGPTNPYNITPETLSFQEASAGGFRHAISCPDVVYSTDPITAIMMQYKNGRVMHNTKRVWLFSTREAFLVELYNTNKIRVLKRWENIPSSVFGSIMSNGLSSRQTSASMRCISAESYDLDSATGAPEALDAPEALSAPEALDAPETTVAYTSFTPYIQGGGNISFASPRSDTVAVQARLADVISERDRILAGHTMYPDLINSDEHISIAPDFPFIFRITFTNTSGNFYDYQMIFIKVDDERRITGWACYNFSVSGTTSESTVIPWNFGLHSGDSRPYRSNYNIIAHEVVSSTATDRHLISSSPLATFSEMSQKYRTEGYTHAVTVASAYGPGKLLSDIESCAPSILLYTCDENRNPIGYTLSPYLHMQSESVILGVISLTTHANTRSTYHTLGIPSRGKASLYMYTTDPIIETISTVIQQRPELFQDAPEAVVEAAPEAVVEAAPEAVVEAAPEAVVEAAPEAVVEAAPEAVVEATLEATPEDPITIEQDIV